MLASWIICGTLFGVGVLHAILVSVFNIDLLGKLSPRGQDIFTIIWSLGLLFGNPVTMGLIYQGYLKLTGK